MRDAGREGLTQTIEEVRSCRGRRQGSQRQHGDRTSEAQKPISLGNQCRLSRVPGREALRRRPTRPLSRGPIVACSITIWNVR
jgi:hypothetical protein